MDDIADLVTTPFRDIVEKGRTAINNAGDTQQMLKAAQSLVKEGERALKRIEPLCKKHFDEYGSNFLVALRENDEIAKYRLQLTDMLWEFDDYVEVDDFDADKFAELQALSRAAAPKIYDILLKMKLESPVQFDPRFMSQLSPPSSPLPPSSMHFPTAQQPPVPGVTYHLPRDSISSFVTDTTRSGEIQTVEAATEQLIRILGRTESRAESRTETPLEAAPPPVPEPEEEPPRPPSGNPWDIKVAAVSDDGRWGDDMSVSRRPPVEPLPETPVERSSPINPYWVRNFSVPRPIPSPADGRRAGMIEDYGHDSEDRHRSSGSEVSGLSVSPTQTQTQTSRPRGPSMNHNAPPTIPEEYSRGGTDGAWNQSRPQPPVAAYSPMPYRSSPRPRQISQPEEYHHSISESYKSETLSESSQYTGHLRRPSVAESLLDPNPFPVHVRPGSDRPPTTNPESQPGLEAVPRTPITPVAVIDDGLIPVEYAPPTPVTILSQKDCTIDNTSSFHIHKGFCQGAAEVVKGGIGVKKTKKPVGFSATATVARCTHCLYELDFKHIELDVNKQDEGNYTKNGVGYRLRFLQKCHMHAKRVDDIMYACVFCTHSGRTIDESDATVFTSTAALFSHLARHPRPLPDVPGIAVVDQVEVPANLRNDYDLHFRHPPQSHPVREKAADIANLPSGVAKEAARRLFGQKLLPDRTPALELVQGARITGLTWPSRYNGEWCFGWHDGVHASLPTELLKLDRPAPGQINRNGTSRIRGKVRWRFVPQGKDKDKEDWLKLDKDELISNITWAYPEHWCWAGTNAKGKWGIFPQAFIDPNSIQELTAAGSDRASILSNEKNKTSSILPRFSMRHKTGRPPSIAGSTSSSETAAKSIFGGGRSVRKSKGDD